MFGDRLPNCPLMTKTKPVPKHAKRHKLYLSQNTPRTRKKREGEEMKVGFISLGCSKNLIDTEVTIGLFKKHGYEVVNDEEKAEVIVINTCRIY